MRRLYCCFISAVIISTLIMFLAGCSIGVRSRSDDAPPEDDVYREESAHDSYYDGGPRSRVYYYQNPNYDPWKTGTYYQYYSGPPRADRGSGVSAPAGTEDENKRPAVKARDSSSASQSKTSSSEKSGPRRERTSVRGRTKTESKSSRSSTTDQKVKRNAKRRVTQTSQKKQSAHESQVKQRNTQTTPQRTRRKTVKSEIKEKEEEKDEKESQN